MMDVIVNKALRPIGCNKRCLTIMTFSVSSLLLIAFSYSWFEVQMFNSVFARNGLLSNLDYTTKTGASERFQERTPFSHTSSSKKRPPQNQIVFVKVHKAASSTMQNILLRYAMKNNLNVMFYKNALHLGEFGSKIYKNRLVELPPNTKFDILCNHLVFNYSEISPYFPSSTAYVGIVREPFELFRSAFKFYSIVWPRQNLVQAAKINSTHPMQEYLKNPLRFEPKDPRQSNVNNRMSVDFGFPLDNFEEDKRDSKKIQSFLASLDAIFTLVLIADRFDESIILFKRLMNWDMRDILHLKNNVFSRVPRFNTNYTEQDYHRFQEWGTLDYALYNHFLEIFENKIRSQPRFEEEVDAFKKIRAEVSHFCGQVQVNKYASSLLIGPNEWTDEIRVSPLLCKMMAKDEYPFVKLVREVQQKRIKELLK